MSENGYLTAWLIYLLCSLGLLGCVWYLTHSFARVIRAPIRAFSVAFLLLPWPADKGLDSLAPAWLVTFFDGLLKADITMARAGWPLATALLIALVLAFIWTAIRRDKA